MNPRDLVWISILAGLALIVTGLWGLLGLMVLGIGVIGILIAMFLLAGEDILFTFGVQMGAVGIMYGSGEKARLHRLIIIDENGPRAEDAQGKILEPMWFEKKFNIWWLGIPFLGRVYTFPLRVVVEEREEAIENGVVKIKEVRRVVRRVFKFLSLKEELYVVIIPPILCADNFDVVIDVAIYVKAVNPRKALFNIGDFLKAIITKIEMAIRADVGKKNLDTLRAQKAELAKLITEALEDEIKYIKKEWGEKVISIGIRDVTPEREAAEVIKQRAFESVRADAKAEKGRGEEEFHTRVGRGLAKKYKSIAEIADGLGITLRQLDVFETVGSAPSTKIISFPEFSQMLSTISGKDQKTVATILAALGISPEDLPKIFEEIAKLKKGG